MKLLRQATGEQSCGLYAVAMLTGKTVGEVAKVFGKVGKTSTKDIAGALNKMGYGGGIEVIGDDTQYELRGRGVLVLYRADNAAGHAVAYEEGKIYDCDNDGVWSLSELLSAYTKDDGVQWNAVVAIEGKPVKTREWKVGEAK